MVKRNKGQRAFFYIYGWLCNLIFAVVLLYALGFILDFGVSKTINAGPVGALGASLLIDLALIGLFGLQHSAMARQGFKRWWTRIVPEPIERSTYVLASSIVLAVVMLLWRPMPRVVWEVEGFFRYLIWGLNGAGWLLLALASVQINARHLMGLQQVTDYLKGRPPAHPEFQTPGLYRYVRHPLMTGFIIAFWALPTMTLGQLVFAAGMTAYILIGLAYEEQDLIRYFGERYRAYRKRVPALFPRLISKKD